MNIEAGRPVVITIDGPAGSGKSTTAREVARRLGYRHLDSGALYRALTVAVRQAGIPEKGWDFLEEETLAQLDVGLAPDGTGFRVLISGRDPGPDLRSAETTRLAPLLATNPRVRTKLGELQRSALHFGSIVADGRDMGSVVFPDADLKVFLTASLEERSRRRIVQEGRTVDDEALRSEARRIQLRDETDSERKVAPLLSPAGALKIDTTKMTFDEQVQRIVEAVSTLTDGAAEK